MRVSLHRYSLPLGEAVTLKGFRHEARAGIALALGAAEGPVAWGDCAPLPGFSSETLDEAEALLEALVPWLESLRPGPDWAALANPHYQELATRATMPSVRFALELASLDLAAQLVATPLPQLLHPEPQVMLPLSALVTADAVEDVLGEADRLVRRGFRTLKLKVGRGEVECDVEKLWTLRRHLGPEVGLRCDANQAWTLAEALYFAEGVLGLNIDYVEEPLREPGELGALWFDTRLPVALDESLALLEPADLEAKGYATAVVLKPTLLGGMLRTLAFASRARALGMRAIISGAFESGIAMRGHVTLAAATGGEPAGLAPYTRLASDVLQPRLPLDRPLVDVPKLFGGAYEVIPG